MATANPFIDAARILEGAAKKHRQILVGYSGGKESRVVLDLCYKIFEHVSIFQMAFLPDLSVLSVSRDFAKERYGLDTMIYPVETFFSALRNSLYRPETPVFEGLPLFKQKDIYNIVRRDTGIKLMGLGHRKADSLSRRRMFARIIPKQEVDAVYPLRDWTKWDVFLYLKQNNIPVPPTSGTATSGVGLTHSAILWLHDAFPGDYERLKKIFPYAEAQIYRRECYGVGEIYGPTGPIKRPGQQAGAIPDRDAAQEDDHQLPVQSKDSRGKGEELPEA